MDKTSKIPVYFMPGMATGPSIFEHIHLPKDRFDCYYLEWFLPGPKMSLKAYAQQMAAKISHPDPVLIGVSFGGMLIQEMAKFIAVRKLIIISSVKLSAELPAKMRFAKYTNVHKLLPTGIINNLELLTYYAFGDVVKKRLKLYERYLCVKDKNYVDWCIDHTVNWQCAAVPKNLVHIHGNKDTVFPIKHINGCITVENGTHAMVVHRAKWFNERLPTIILE